MRLLVILVPEGEINLSSVVGSYKLFNRANEYWLEKGQKPVFDIVLAGNTKRVNLYNGLFSIHPQVSLEKIIKADLVIVPSLNHNFDAIITRNQPAIAWLSRQYMEGAEIASICTGAFLLAAAGILDGKKCSTHWLASETLRMRFPKVHIQADQTITDEDGIYTNGGAYSFLNLLIYLVAKYYDRQTSIYLSKVFQIEYDRNSQSPFSIFSGQKKHEDDMVKNVQTHIEHSIAEKISFEELASNHAVSRRNFDRRFIKATGNTPLEYAQRVKIEAAKRALESTRKNVNQIMYDCGYSDPKAFRDVFRKHVGISPLEYRKRFE